MISKEWDKYFKILNKDRKEEIRVALFILDNDPMFKKAYGSDFKELINIIDFPFNQS